MNVSFTILKNMVYRNLKLKRRAFMREAKALNIRRGWILNKGSLIYLALDPLKFGKALLIQCRCHTLALLRLCLIHGNQSIVRLNLSHLLLQVDSPAKPI